MTPQAFDVVHDAMMHWLPAKMHGTESRAMLYAIGLQESRFRYRRQIGGPARGWWQFEQGGGVVGVLGHGQTRDLIRVVLDALGYDYSPEASYTAIEHNDILAMTYARLPLAPSTTACTGVPLTSSPPLTFLTV